MMVGRHSAGGQIVRVRMALWSLLVLAGFAAPPAAAQIQESYPVRNLTVTVDADNVATISWDHPIGYPDQIDDGFTRYQVDRRAEGSDAFSAVTSPVLGLDLDPLPHTETHTFTDDARTPGVAYEYKVITWDVDQATPNGAPPGFRTPDPAREGAVLGEATSGLIQPVSAVSIVLESVRIDSTENGGGATIRVTLTGEVAGGLTVTPTYTDGTAIANTDYTPNTDAIEFVGDGPTEMMEFDIAFIDDEFVEEDETFTVGATVSGTTEQIDVDSIELTIVNNILSVGDVATMTLAVDGDTEVTQGDNLRGTVTVSSQFQVELPLSAQIVAADASGAESVLVAVPFTLPAEEDSATFTISTASVDASAGDRTVSLRVRPFGQDLPEWIRAGSSTCQPPGCAGSPLLTFPDDVADITVLQDNRLSIENVSADEGDDLEFTVTLRFAVSGGVTVTPTYTDGSAISRTDYTPNTGAITFAGTEGETQTFSVTTIDNNRVEGDRNFTVGLMVSNGPDRLDATDTATGAIREDDNAVVSITPENPIGYEGGSVMLTLTLESAVTGGLTVTPVYFPFLNNPPSGFALGVNSAIAGEDYTANVDPITFTGEEEETQTFVVMIPDDDLVEFSKTFHVGLLGRTTRTTSRFPEGPSANVTIRDNDIAAMTIDDASVNAGSPLVFTLRLSNPIQVPIGLTVQLRNTISGRLVRNQDFNFPAGVTSATFTHSTTAADAGSRFRLTLVERDIPDGLAFEPEDSSGLVQQVNLDEASAQGTVGDPGPVVPPPNPRGSTNPRVTSGGTAAFENQVVAVPEAAGRGWTVVFRLPPGMNFVGTPVATGVGVELQDAAGDPDMRGRVRLTDANRDGGSDRAEVRVATSPAAGATITWTGELTYRGDTEVGDLGVRMAVHHVFDDNGTSRYDSRNDEDVEYPLVEVVTADQAGTVALDVSSGDLLVLPNMDLTTTGVDPSAIILLTVPGGAGGPGANGITLTLGAGQRFVSGAQATVTEVLTDDSPALAAAAATQSAGNTLGLTLNGPAPRQAQYLVMLPQVLTSEVDDAPRNVSVSLAGNAGLRGSAAVFRLAERGSGVAIAPNDDGAPDLRIVVRGAARPQTLADIEITEFFAEDFDGTAPGTITVTPPAGVSFAGSTPTVRVTAPNGAVPDLVSEAVQLTDDGNIVITWTTSGTGEQRDTLILSSVAITAEESVTGPVVLAVGRAEGDHPNAPATSVTVATTIERGTVTVELADDAQPENVGQGTTANVVALALTESTYGAIAQAPPGTTGTFIQIGGSAAVARINSVTTRPTSADSGPNEINGLSFGEVLRASPDDGSWVVEVVSESSERIEAGDNVRLTIDYDVAADARVGSNVTFTLTGPARVRDVVRVGTVSETSVSTTVGQIPDVEPRNPDPARFATVTIRENFEAALRDGCFSVIAPVGITFSGLAPDSASDNVMNPDVQPTTRFSANDTVVLCIEGLDPAEIDVISFRLMGFISGEARPGLARATIIDGEGDSATGLELTMVDLVYVGGVGTLRAGADARIGIGFTVVRAIEGGRQPLTIETSDEAVASPSLSGSVVTLTGLAVGTATITVTDELGATDSFAVTVTAGPDLPEISGATTDGSATAATFRGGVSADGGVTYPENGVVSLGDEIEIVFTITPDEAHVGEEAWLFLVVQDLGANNALSALNSVGTLVPVTAANPGNGLAILAETTLSEMEVINTLGGKFLVIPVFQGLAVNLFTGYALKDDPLVIYYNATPFPLAVE